MKKVLSTVHFYVPCLFVALAALMFVTSAGCSPEKKPAGEASSAESSEVKSGSAEEAKSESAELEAESTAELALPDLSFNADSFDGEVVSVSQTMSGVTQLGASQLFARRAPAKPVLYFYTWADYIDPELVKKFEKQFNCVVKEDYFESNEAMLAKLQSGNVSYDIILPSTYMVDIMQREGLLRKLDAKKLPNAMKFVDPVVAKKLKDEKMENSVPYLMSFTGLGYNAKVLGEAPTSWTIFADAKYKGRMTMLDDMREAIGVGLMCCGYDPNTTDEKEIAEARDLIISWKGNLAKFGVDDVKSGLQNGEFYIIQGYGGDIMQMTEEDENIQFAMPEEGALFAADHFVIPKNARNVDLAHAFINFFCDPNNSAPNMEFTQFVAPIPRAMPKVSEDLRESPCFTLYENGFESVKMIEDVGDDISKYSKAWDEIKAAK